MRSPTRLGRLGAAAADHPHRFLVAWALALAVLGSLAPFAGNALSGGGWEARGSASAHARAAIDARFPGRAGDALAVAVQAPDGTRAAAAAARVGDVLRADPAVRAVLPPDRAADGRTLLVTATAAAGGREMVAAAGRLAARLAAVRAPGVTVRLTGRAALWSEFNAANKSAMARAEELTWPVTLVLLVLAFGTLVAAGLPLLLTAAGLLGAGGLLFLAAQVLEISIWALNFSMMFAIALGIDYALFVVVRYRAALAAGAEPRAAVVAAMETAGRAVLASGLTVIAALAVVTLVPVPTFRSVPLGIALTVAVVLAATLTLLPALLALLGRRVDGGRLRVGAALGGRSERYARWAERLWAQPLRHGLPALAVLALLALPALGLRTGVPAASAVPADAPARTGLELVERAFGPGAANPLVVLAPARDTATVRRALTGTQGVAAVGPPERAGGWALVTARPAAGAGDAGLARTVDRVRAALPAGARLGGPAAEERDLERALVGRLPLVVAGAALVGFAFLCAVLRAPILAALAVLLNLLATLAAFGVARLVFQDGLLDSVLGFESQGFISAWGPIFFFALAFALAMDYTVFLLATIREERARGADDRAATVAGLASSGRAINAAAGIMVAVFLSFALAGQLPLKEMGVVLAVAVALDSTLVRLLLQPVLLRLLGRWAWAAPRLPRRGALARRVAARGDAAV